MALGREVYDAAWRVALQQLPDPRAIADVAVHKLIPPIACDCLQVAEISRIGEFVEIHDGG